MSADGMTDFGITYRQYAVLCAKGLENLPTGTTVTIEDVDAILTWVLPDYREILRGDSRHWSDGTPVDQAEMDAQAFE